MKKRAPYFLIVLLCLLYACETDEETNIPQEDTTTEITPPIEIDPTLISEYHISPNSENFSRIYYFDNQGKFI